MLTLLVAAILPTAARAINVIILALALALASHVRGLLVLLMCAALLCPVLRCVALRCAVLYFSALYHASLRIAFRCASIHNF
eukprot:10700383-Alexandrium_andersonii.AAC.1